MDPILQFEARWCCVKLSPIFIYSWVFYRIYFGEYVSDLHDLTPSYAFFYRLVRKTKRRHRFMVNIPRIRTNRFRSTFIIRTSKLCSLSIYPSLLLDVGPSHWRPLIWWSDDISKDFDSDSKKKHEKLNMVLSFLLVTPIYQTRFTHAVLYFSHFFTK